MYNCVYGSIVSFGSFLSKFVIQCTVHYSNSFTLETAAFAELGARLCLKSISCRVAPKQAHQIDMQNVYQGGDPNGIVQRWYPRINLNPTLLILGPKTTRSNHPGVFLILHCGGANLSVACYGRLCATRTVLRLHVQPKRVLICPDTCWASRG